MNKIFLLLWACCLLPMAGCSTKDGSCTIELYANNDIHGKYFDSLYVNNTANPYSLANISEYVKQRRAAAGKENILLIDVGDALQGDNAAYYFNYVDTVKNKRHLFSRVVEYVQYDALVVGNHDIEAGHPVYDRIKLETNIPYLAANAIDEKTGKSYFEPYTIVNKNGVKIAIVGMTNPHIKSWLGENLWSGIDFLPVAGIADSLAVEIIKREKPDVMILAIHAGLGTENDSTDLENPARYLARTLQGYDIILASHDHRTACEKIWNGTDSVLLMEAGSRAQYLMNAQIQLDFQRGKLTGKQITGRLIPLENTPVDKEYLAAFRDDFLQVKEFTSEEVGELSNDIYTKEAFFGPSGYMDLIHFIQLAESDADISFAAPLTQNGYIKAGKLNYQDLFTIYPFENQLYIIDLTGQQIKDYLEFSYDAWIQTMQHPNDHIINMKYNEKTSRWSFRNMSFNFDSAAGIKYDVDVSKPKGERIVIYSRTDGQPFDVNAHYKVALSSYRANGGGDLLTQGAGIPREQLPAIILEKMPDIRDIIYAFYKSNADDRIIKGQAWKFVPENLTSKALLRDKKLLFGE